MAPSSRVPCTVQERNLRADAVAGVFDALRRLGYRLVRDAQRPRPEPGPSHSEPTPSPEEARSPTTIDVAESLTTEQLREVRR